MPQNDTVLDAATRFLRSNPELLDLARRGAAEHHVSVEALLADTVRRVRRSGFEASLSQGSRGRWSAPRRASAGSAAPSLVS